MKVHELKEGDVLIADGKLECIPEGTRVMVWFKNNNPYVDCLVGPHCLSTSDTYSNGELKGFSGKEFNDGK